ncbi:MAG: ScpA family protein [Halobacteria archaeon]|nr:ScpA family protein [Halobacteria archaeon]
MKRKQPQKPTETDTDGEGDAETSQDAIDEPVDVLVNLAEEGEIDPWDIDIPRVTDKFLERIDSSDLIRTGKALLYASVLLRMKSDYVVDAEDEDEDEESHDDGDEEPALFHVDSSHDESGSVPGNGNDPVDSLEAEMERRLERKTTRRNAHPETLDELVRELRERERKRVWKQRREYDTTSPSSSAAYSAPVSSGARPREPGTTQDAVETAHEDDIEDEIERVSERLATEFERRDEVLFRELIAGVSSKSKAINTYLSLLFLSSRGEVSLEQDEFYGDLWVKDID